MTECADILRRFPQAVPGVQRGVEYVCSSSNNASLARFTRKLLEGMAGAGHFDEQKGESAVFGLAAVLLAHCLPQFVQATVTRCFGGLWSSLGLAEYQSEYFRVMEAAMKEAYDVKDLTRERRDCVEAEVGELQRRVLQLQETSKLLSSMRAGARQP